MKEFEIKIYGKSLEIIAQVISSLFLVPILGYFINISSSLEDKSALVLFLIMALVLILGVALNIKTLRTPILILDEKGIFYHNSLTEWERIEDVFNDKKNNITLVLNRSKKDPYVWYNTKTKTPEVYIDSKSLKVDFKKLISFFRIMVNTRKNGQYEEMRYALQSWSLSK